MVGEFFRAKAWGEKNAVNNITTTNAADRMVLLFVLILCFSFFIGFQI
jgi:hypothetical protein